MKAGFWRHPPGSRSHFWALGPSWHRVKCPPSRRVSANCPSALRLGSFGGRHRVGATHAGAVARSFVHCFNVIIALQLGCPPAHPGDSHSYRCDCEHSPTTVENSANPHVDGAPPTVCLRSRRSAQRSLASGTFRSPGVQWATKKEHPGAWSVCARTPVAARVPPLVPLRESLSGPPCPLSSRCLCQHRDVHFFY